MLLLQCLIRVLTCPFLQLGATCELGRHHSLAPSWMLAGLVSDELCILYKTVVNSAANRHLKLDLSHF